ncbi:hypothetical protein KEM48_013846 [Puccinia striiformis f. sp. tritici PST-130]|nr:hypothetical protein KEM48_013846 [Puccinia striiformis f. sp. tritici PST-130]
MSCIKTGNVDDDDAENNSEVSDVESDSQLSLDGLPDPMTRDASGNQIELSHHELKEWKKKTGLKSNASKKIKPRLKRRDRVIEELARIHRIELAKLTLELDNCFNNDPAYSELKILQGRIKERELELARVPCIQRDHCL